MDAAERTTDVMAVWRHIESRLPSSMRIYLRNIPAKFHRDPIWNDGALGLFLKSVAPARKKQDEY